MTQDNEQQFVVAVAEAARRLADRPVLLRIGDPGGRLGRTPAIGLRRENRQPAEQKRSLLMGRKGKGVFIGWMPVGLTGIHLAPDADTTRRDEREPRFFLRRLSLPELFLRCAFKSPKTVLRALRLLMRGNGKGFDFRLFRLCNSLSAPAYRDWCATDKGLPAPTIPPSAQKNPLVILSGATDALHGQNYPDLIIVPATQVRALATEHAHRDILWLPLPPDIALSPDAIEDLARPFRENPDLAALYCDEDEMDRNGNRHSPFFRPGWNPPLAASGWLRLATALFRLRHLPDETDLESETIATLLQTAAQRGAIAHLPRVLMQRHTPRPAPPQPPVPPQPKTPGPVSVVIPTRDRAELLSACLDGLLNGTRHGGLDIIVIDNSSREPETLALFARHEAAGHIRRIAMPGPFNFARACNLGAAAAHHEALLLLNNDIEPLDPSWLARLHSELDDPSVGAAGALLLFPDGSVQHGGVMLAGDSIARHSFHFLRPEDGEDGGLLAQRRHVSAVTAACLLTRRRLWSRVGGMNERDLTVAFNDVDYCLKLREAGQAIVWTPHARLLHRESMSRGADDTPEKQARFAREERYMHQRWGALLYNDPFHNPNLSLAGEDFSLEARPRDRAVRIVR